jgi:hypothetical protein
MEIGDRISGCTRVRNFGRVTYTSNIICGSMARLARIVGVVNFLAYIKKSLYVVIGAVLTCAGAFWIRL